MATGVDTPVEEGEQYTVEIDDVEEDGDGIAHVGDFLLVVPEGDLGDRVIVRVDTVREEYAAASVIEEEPTG